MSAKQNPLVSIWCMTYNHAGYIKDAIEGFLNQETTFEYEIIIHDDASTDGTTEILKEYEKKHNPKLKILYEKENIYSKKDGRKILDELKIKNIRGRYIALCEGDDYWIDKNKLETQIQYMESHPECTMTCHSSIWLDSRNGEKKEFHPYIGTRELSVDEIICKKNGNVSTASIVAKKEMYLRNSDFPICCVGDIPLQFYALHCGKVFYFDECMSVYRYRTSGSWGERTAAYPERIIQHNLDMLQFLKEFNIYTGRKHEKPLFETIKGYFYDIVYKPMGCETYKQYINLINLVKGTRNSKEKEILQMCRDLACARYTELDVGADIKNFLTQHEHVVLYGAGKFSTIYSRKLIRDGYEVDGYLVSDNQKIEKRDLGPIIHISESPFEKEKMGLIIAVHPSYNKEVLREIAEKLDVDIIMPFSVDEEKLKELLM